MNTLADPTLADADATSAQQARQQRNVAVAVATAAVALLLLVMLGGGVLMLRSGSSAPVIAGAPVSSSATPSSIAGAGGVASPVAVGTDRGASIPSTSAAPASPVTSASPAPAPAPAPAPKPAPAPVPAPAPKPTPPAKPSAPAATITSFVTPENIDCHNGNFKQFSASFTTTNAVKTTISIDGPGIYKTYGPNETEIDLPFNCSSPHTFLLTAFNQDGKTVTKSITLQPRNVQVPTSNDDQ